jgi:hypothetical protein
MPPEDEGHQDLSFLKTPEIVGEDVARAATVKPADRAQRGRPPPSRSTFGATETNAVEVSVAVLLLIEPRRLLFSKIALF